MSQRWKVVLLALCVAAAGVTVSVSSPGAASATKAKKKKRRPKVSRTCLMHRLALLQMAQVAMQRSGAVTLRRADGSNVFSNRIRRVGFDGARQVMVATDVSGRNVYLRCGDIVAMYQDKKGRVEVDTRLASPQPSSAN